MAVDRSGFEATPWGVRGLCRRRYAAPRTYVRAANAVDHRTAECGGFTRAALRRNAGCACQNGHLIFRPAQPRESDHDNRSSGSLVGERNGGFRSWRDKWIPWVWGGMIFRSRAGEKSPRKCSSPLCHKQGDSAKSANSFSDEVRIYRHRIFDMAWRRYFNTRGPLYSNGPRLLMRRGPGHPSFSSSKALTC